MQPRTGSSLLRNYLVDMTDYINLSELFNHNVDTATIQLVSNSVSVNYPSNLGRTSLEEDELITRSNQSLEALAEMSALNKFGVFSVLIKSFQDTYPELSKLISGREDIQAIRLERADVLYGHLSIAISRETKIWHNQTSLAADRHIDPFGLSIKWLENMLDRYLVSLDYTKLYFNNAPVIYYEEFQTAPIKMTTLFSGIPKKIVSTGINKFIGNYKDLVTNIVEVENFYEQFVNEHKEYFPQYFNKLPYIKIPAAQGRQPRDLSLNTLEETI
jgi:hypothetical protein